MAHVLFLQLPPPRFCFEEPPANIPLAAGFLSTALEDEGPKGITAEILDPSIVDVFADQPLLLEVLKRSPTIVAMTLYVWNVERSLFLASNIKRNSPDTRILVGGPEVTPDNVWLINHPAVDAGVFGEGESRIGPMVAMLFEERSADGLKGFFLKSGGDIHVDRHAAEPWDLFRRPYPYVNGKISPARDGTIFLETVRGCPFRCRYCYYHKAFEGVRAYPSGTVDSVLDFAYQEDSGVEEIYLMDPTFNARKGFRRLLRSMAARREARNIRIHTELRADLLTEADVALLKEAGLASAEVGLQTISPEAIRLAGRRSDPEKVARGVRFLKEASIDVTTGIILGLPGDTPEGFKRTCRWLKQRDAYSVVHPFVLSILPGTDFRATADQLGIKYHPRPPYYALSTATFPAEEFRSALLECEAVFEMELDYVSPPSLVDNGPGLIDDPVDGEYISKWIVDLRTSRWSEVIDEVIRRASDPFTFWFKGRGDEGAMLSILHQFGNANPHACVHVVLDLPEVPSLGFFQEALEAAAFPDHYLNRAYRPLYEEEEIVSLNFWIILPDPGSDDALQRGFRENYETVAGMIWETTGSNVREWPETSSPVLVSGYFSETWKQEERSEMFAALQRFHTDRAEEVFFRDSYLHQQWQREALKILPGQRLSESILST